MSKRARYHVLVDGFAGRRVVLFGDLVLDRFVLGSPKRISREAPVIILRCEGQRDVPGGGANALANIAALGGNALPVGVVGDDESGRSLLAILAERGIDTASIEVVPGLKTITKVRVLAGGASSLKHQVARYDIEDWLPSEAPCREMLLDRLAQVAGSAHAAAISDYGYGVVTRGGVARLRTALPIGAPTVADSRFALTELGSVDGATPNLEELVATAGTDLVTDNDVADAAERLLVTLDARFLLATRGSHGGTLAIAGQPPVHLPVFGSDQVADVTGAGDTVLATMTLALAAGATPVEAANLAMLAGGIVVMKLGTATVSAEELHHAIDAAPVLHG